MWGSSIYLQLDLLQVKVGMIVNRDPITGQLESSEPNVNMVVHEERASPQDVLFAGRTTKKAPHPYQIALCPTIPYKYYQRRRNNNKMLQSRVLYRIGAPGAPPGGPRACRPKHSSEESISRWRCWKPLPCLGNDSIMGSLPRLIHSVPCCFDLFIDYIVTRRHGHILRGVQASICALYKT